MYKYEIRLKTSISQNIRTEIASYIRPYSVFMWKHVNARMKSNILEKYKVEINIPRQINYHHDSVVYKFDSPKRLDKDYVLKALKGILLKYLDNTFGQDVDRIEKSDLIGAVRKQPYYNLVKNTIKTTGTLYTERIVEHTMHYILDNLEITAEHVRDLEKYTMSVFMKTSYMDYLMYYVKYSKIEYMIDIFKKMFPECRVNYLCTDNYILYVRKNTPFCTIDIEKRINEHVQDNRVDIKECISHIKHNPTRYARSKPDIKY